MHILYFGCLATDLLDFFYKLTILCCYGNYVGEGYPQNVSLSAAYCYLVYMNRTLFSLIAFDYLILTFKVKRSRKIPDIF